MISLKFNSITGGIKRFLSTNPISFPITLLFVSLVTYGVFISSLGFYWDDWPPIFVSHIAEKSAFWKYFRYDRPFQSWTYYFLSFICRDSTFTWQLAAILFRWTAGLTLYYSFLQVFPRARDMLRWAAVLFVVFPGFADQYASVAFSSHLLVYTVFGASLLSMLLAIKSKRFFWVFFPISLLLTAVHLFSMEYFVGLEALRPVLIYIYLRKNRENGRGVFSSTLIRWFPYLVLLIIYLYWRIAIYPASMAGEGSDNFPRLFSALVASPKDTLVAFATTMASDLRFLFITIWTDRLVPEVLPFERITFWLSLVVGFGASFGVGYILYLEKHEDTSELSKKDFARILGIALLIVFFGLLPAWSTYRQITLGKWSDRYSLAAIFGVALFFSAFLHALSQKLKLRTIVLAMMVGLSISFQVQTANDYRKDFSRQQNFYQQLSWRAPGLEPGTTLYSINVPANKEADYSFTMGINLLYSTDKLNTDLEYWFTTPRYYDPELLYGNPGTPIIHRLRTLEFEGTASNLLSINMPETGCLWVVDEYYPILQKELDVQAEITDSPNYLIYSRISNPEVIKSAGLPGNNLSRIIDFSPQETWCYYFEKADLAQSKGDFNTAAELYEETVDLGLEPVEGVEYLPFIKAYNALGNVESAVKLTDLMFTKSYFTKPMMCQFWHDTITNNREISISTINQVYNAENCPQFFGKE